MKIDLGSKPSEPGGDMMAASPDGGDEPSMSYPSVFLTDVSSDDFPEAGKTFTALCTFKVSGKNAREDTDGKKSSVDLDLIDIDPKGVAGEDDNEPTEESDSDSIEKGVLDAEKSAGMQE